MKKKPKVWGEDYYYMLASKKTGKIFTFAGVYLFRRDAKEWLFEQTEDWLKKDLEPRKVRIVGVEE